jgi:hypothetical protein
MMQHTDSLPTLAQLRGALEQQYPADLVLAIEFAGWRASVRSNSTALLDELASYFGDLVSSRQHGAPTPASDVALPWTGA